MGTCKLNSFMLYTVSTERLGFPLILLRIYLELLLHNDGSRNNNNLEQFILADYNVNIALVVQ